MVDSFGKELILKSRNHFFIFKNRRFLNIKKWTLRSLEGKYRRPQAGPVGSFGAHAPVQRDISGQVIGRCVRGNRDIGVHDGERKVAVARDDDAVGRCAGHVGPVEDRADDGRGAA